MRDETVYLRHVGDAIGRIERYTAGGPDGFLGDPMVQDAVIRNLEVIGEAVGHLSQDFRRRHPETPWRSITALRNVLVHEYFGVDLDIVWGVVEKRLPVLKGQVQKLLGGPRRRKV